MNVKDVLKYGHLWVLKHVDGLSSQEWDEPGVCGVWSVKEILSHLASFEVVLFELLGELGGDIDATPTLNQFRTLDGDSFNAIQVSSRKASTPQDVLSEYNRVQAHVMQRIELISDEIFRQTGALPWYGREYDLEDFIVYSFYGHKREHMAQVAVYRDRIGK
jgi:hypothetical protein